MNAKLPQKIVCGRVVMLPVARDPVYVQQNISESMRGEEQFRKFLTSSNNQIMFITSLTKFFLRKEDGPSEFSKYLEESCQAVVSTMPDWFQQSKRKIKSFGIFGAIVR